MGLRIDRGEQADHARPRLTGVVVCFEETGEGERGASIENLEVSQDQRRRGLEAALHTSKPDSGTVNGCQGGVEDVGLAPVSCELVDGSGELSQRGEEDSFAVRLRAATPARITPSGFGLTGR